MKYNRFLPLLIPIVVFLLLELFYFRPELIYVTVVLVALIFFFTTRQFVRVSESKENWFNFSILPFTFSLGLILFTVLMPSKLMVQVLFLFNTIFLYFYFRTIYYFLIRKNNYKESSLENISSYGNFLALFFLFSSIYGFQSFLNISVWPLMIAVIVSVALVVYQVIWINRVNFNKGVFYIILSCLVLVEISWSLSFLPISYYLLGLILAISYYILIGLTRFHLLDRLNKRLVKLYLIFGFGSIIIILLTARWL